MAHQSSSLLPLCYFHSIYHDQDNFYVIFLSTKMKDLWKQESYLSSENVSEWLAYTMESENIFPKWMCWIYCYKRRNKNKEVGRYSQWNLYKSKIWFFRVKLSSNNLAWHMWGNEFDTLHRKTEEIWLIFAFWLDGKIPQYNFIISFIFTLPLLTHGN